LKNIDANFPERPLADEAGGLPRGGETLCLLAVRACSDESCDLCTNFSRGQPPAAVLHLQQASVSGEDAKVSYVRVVYAAQLFEKTEVSLEARGSVAGRVLLDFSWRRSRVKSRRWRLLTVNNFLSEN
jgi:hypothetical protein